MRPAALVSVAGLALFGVLTRLPGQTLVPQSAIRPPPSRPAAVAPSSSTAGPLSGSAKLSGLPALRSTRLGGTDYLRLKDVAAFLGLRLVWPGAGSIVLLKDGARPVARLGDHSREINCLGLRAFLGDPVLVHRGEFYVSRIDVQSLLAPVLRPAWAGPPPPRPRLIAIDPGHGGSDPGEINHRLNLNEKTLALDTAKRLQKLLAARGYRVVLTRTEDRFVGLPERPVIAARAGADVFISLHFNSVLSSPERTNGLEVYRFTPQFQMPSTRSQRRPDSDDLANPGNANDRWNSILGQVMLTTLLRDLPLADRGFKHDRLHVLRLAQCPAILVEGGFLSNDAEARKIATPAYRQQLAEALADGIRSYAIELDRLRARTAP